MDTIRNKYDKLARIIWFAFALHIFNLSIDPRDREPAFTGEDLTVNDIESIAEFFAEVVFGFTDAFTEHDEADDYGSVAMDFSKVFFSNQDIWHLIGTNFSTIHIRYFVYNSNNLLLLAREIHAPPPKA